MVRIILLLTVFPVLIISGCNSSSVETPTVDVQMAETQAPTQQQMKHTEEVYVFKTSQPGYFTIKGRLTAIDPMLMFPDLDDGMFLVPMDDQAESISTIPQFEKGTVPQAEVDELTGDFVFTNIESGQYAVVVLTMDGDQVPARFLESESFAIFTIEESDDPKTIELGYLLFP